MGLWGGRGTRHSNRQWSVGRPLTCSPHLRPPHTCTGTSDTTLRETGGPRSPTLPCAARATGTLGAAANGGWWGLLSTLNRGLRPHRAASGTQGPSGVTSAGKPPGPSPLEAGHRLGLMALSPLPTTTPREGRADGPERSRREP